MALKYLETSPSAVLFVASNPTKIEFDLAEELHRIEEAGRAYPESFGVIARWSLSLEQFKQVLDRHKSEGVRVIPILIRECDLAGVPFAGLRRLPTGSKPVKK